MKAGKLILIVAGVAAVGFVGYKLYKYYNASNPTPEKPILKPSGPGPLKTGLSEEIRNCCGE